MIGSKFFNLWCMMIHNVILLIEKVFCGKPVVEDKMKSSNHSIWQLLICLKESLGKKHRNIWKANILGHQVSSGSVCRCLPFEIDNELWSVAVIWRGHLIKARTGGHGSPYCKNMKYVSEDPPLWPRGGGMKWNISKLSSQRKKMKYA